MACGGSGNDAPQAPPPLPPPPPSAPSLATGPANCVGGLAEDYGCLGIALQKRMPVETMGGSSIKVYADHAYVIGDGAGPHGMQVFDLTRLRAVSTPEQFLPDAVYGDFENAHNIAINEATGFAYAVGTNTCGEGLHMIDIRTPVNPVFAGCHWNRDTHDTQCVVYAGPDPDYPGREICVSSNGSEVELVDVTLKADPVTISTVVYPELGFVHQGWLTEDHAWFLLGDETDETIFDGPTRTHVFDVSDLDAPVYAYAYEARYFGATGGASVGA